MGEIKRAPVRIQVWLPDNVRLEVRGWLDEFTSSMDTPAIDHNWASRFVSHHNYKVSAHTNADDPPWKFERGKPKVEA